MVRDTQDLDFNLSPGSHTLSMEIDYQNNVSETSESDNGFDTSAYWYNGQITAEGEVWWQHRLSKYNMTWHTLNFYPVEIWDRDIGGVDDLLATTFTNDTGEFYFGPIPNEEEDGTRQDIYLMICAETDAVVVGDSMHLSYPYGIIPKCISPDTIFDVWSGHIDWTYPFWIEADTSESAFFYVANIVRQTDSAVTATTGLDINTTKLMLYDLTGAGSIYIDTFDIIFINSDPEESFGPDYWDADVVNHEFGHRLEHCFDVFDSTLGTIHWFHKSTSPEMAVNEGFAHFWSAFVKNDPVLFNVDSSWTCSSWVNVENGKYGLKGVCLDTPCDATI